MSPRPPPKISLKHEWKRELGSEVAREPEGEVARQREGEVARQAKFFQPTQPIPNPIRERSGRLDNMQDGRNTSRSQGINVQSLCEETVTPERPGRPVTGKPVYETSVIQTHSSENGKDFNVEQAHERTRRPVVTHDVINVSDSSQTFRDLRITTRVPPFYRGLLFVFWGSLALVLSGCPDLSSTELDTCTGEMSLSVRSSRSRALVSISAGDEDELEEDEEERLPCLESVLEVNVSDPEDKDKPGTTIGTKFSVLHCIRSPFLNEMWFLTIDPFVRVSVYIAKLSER